MKWGRKKCAPSSSPPSIINRVFSGSWFFSKFKQKGGSFQTTSSTNKNKTEVEYPTPASNLRGGRFYSMDENDAFWRLSFGEETLVPARRSTGGINPLSYDHGLQEHRNFNDMVLDINKIRQKQRKQKAMTENGAAFKEDKYSNSAERDIYPIEPQKKVYIARKKENYSEHVPIVPQKQNIEHLQCKTIRVKADSIPKQREVHIRKTKQKTYSPRTECKIRALEEIKKARMKSKKNKEKVVDGKTIFDSFAVVKNSFNPQKDFRDSMVEMIREKGIKQPDELEELLACYLTMNCDEYHELIIKVFRQVWFELNEDS